MDKFVSIEKMSKKAKKEYYAKRRKDWGNTKPVTRIEKSPKTYSRKKNKKIAEEDFN